MYPFPTMFSSSIKAKQTSWETLSWTMSEQLLTFQGFSFFMLQVLLTHYTQQTELSMVLKQQLDI